MSDLSLPSFKFRKEREALWLEFEYLLARSDKSGLRSLAAYELERLPILYRHALSSLSVARTISLDGALVEYLEGLAGRGYICVYGTRSRVTNEVADFFVHGFPSQVRRAKWPILVATLFLVGGVLAGFFLTMKDSDIYYAFAGDTAQGRTPATSTEELKGALYDEGTPAEALTDFASTLFTHNAGIGILCFALGFLFGLPVFFLLLKNGLALGAFAALYHGRGLSLDLWGWLLPHGITELGAICLCGGAGLMLGRAMIVPGRKSRLQNLADEGKKAVVIVMGAVVMLFVAGAIEGIFRQTITSISVRYTVALITLVFWFAYLGWCGKGRDVPQPE